MFSFHNPISAFVRRWWPLQPIILEPHRYGCLEDLKERGLTISSQSLAGFWYLNLQPPISGWVSSNFWHGFVWTWGTQEFNGFIDDLQFSSLSHKKKNNTWGVLHVLHIPYVCTRGHHIFSNHLKSSSSGSLHSWTKSWYCSSVAVFFSLGSTFTCGTPHGSPGHISARPVQHTGAWRERRGRWVRDDLMDVLAQDAHVSAPRQGGMPCLADVHWSNI